MTDPLRIAFDVACPVEHAFSTWTTRMSTWWPNHHTVSGDPGTDVVLEPGVGGRIYEQTTDGVEHVWGVITIWEPPTRLGYRWHLGRGAAEATDVQVHFDATGSATTQVRIEHTGWERLGPAADVWRDRNHLGWTTVLPLFAAAAQGHEPGPHEVDRIRRQRSQP